MFEKVQRKFHPLMIARHGEILAQKANELQRAVASHSSGERGEGGALEVLLEASRLVIEACTRFRESEDLQAGVFNALRAGRKVCQARELLFPMRHEVRGMEAVFGEDPLHGQGEADRIVHLGEADDRYARGAASLYVPPASEGLRPLVVALHGGYGHGRDYLWTWIREARSRRFFVLAPTSQDATWSLLEPEIDLLPLLQLISTLARDLPFDPGKVLLTGFSDGATFCLGCAMQEKAVFNAFNPISGVLPPGDLSAVRARRIFWLHGAYDWMFHPSRSQAGRDILAQAGAEVTLRIIEDLAHAIPLEENRAVLSWFDPSLFP